jgi:hypothetical protein
MYSTHHPTIVLDCTQGQQKEEKFRCYLSRHGRFCPGFRDTIACLLKPWDLWRIVLMSLPGLPAQESLDVTCGRF